VTYSTHAFAVGSPKADFGAKLAKYFNKNNVLTVDLPFARAYIPVWRTTHDREHQASPQAVRRAKVAASAPAEPRQRHRKPRPLGQQSGAAAADTVRWEDGLIGLPAPRHRHFRARDSRKKKSDDAAMPNAGDGRWQAPRFARENSICLNKPQNRGKTSIVLP
jgi:hypothetical protein